MVCQWAARLWLNPGHCFCRVDRSTISPFTCLEAIVPDRENGMHLLWFDHGLGSGAFGDADGEC